MNIPILEVGTLLQGRYLIREAVGRGLLANGYVAEDTRLFGRRVMIKCPLREHSEPQMRNELRALAAIKHPNVTSVRDWGETTDGTLFVVHEILDGVLTSLSEEVGHDGLEPDRVSRIARTVGDALSAVHAHGIVHRDIHPGNVRLQSPGSRFETPFIVDFGRAALVGDEVGDCAPYVPYIAPENMRVPGRARTSGDVFSLAAVLFFALTGQRQEIARGQELSEIAWPDHLSPAALNVLGEGLSADPVRRPSARDLGERLAIALSAYPHAAAIRPSPLRVFLCHASPDKARVRELYQLLVARKIDAWFDEAKLLPGQDWQLEISTAVRNSDVVVVCLSAASTTREGFVQKEIRLALDVSEEKPEGTIFIVPVRLEPCAIPQKLSDRQWVDLFVDTGFDSLLGALRSRASRLQRFDSDPANNPHSRH